MPQTHDTPKAKAAAAPKAVTEPQKSPKDALKGKGLAEQEAALKPKGESAKPAAPKKSKVPAYDPKLNGPDAERALDHGTRDYSTSVKTIRKNEETGKYEKTGYDADAKPENESPRQWAQTQYWLSMNNVVLKEAKYFGSSYNPLKHIAEKPECTAEDAAEWPHLQSQTAIQAKKALEHIDGALKMLDERHKAVLTEKIVDEARKPILGQRENIANGAASAATWKRPKIEKKKAH